MAAKYTFTELKKAAKSNERIGRWKDTNVYSCSKYDYNPANGGFYVLYDDGNKLVKKGYVYGSIDDRGSIDECDQYWYNVPIRESAKVTKKIPATSGYSDQVIGDEFFSRIDREINELLTGVGQLDLSQSYTFTI